MTESERNHLTIGEASEETGLPESTIRYYDGEFSDFLNIKRGNNNQRLFTDQNLEDLQYVRYLIKREELSIDEVRDRLRLEHEFQNREKRGEPTPTDEEVLVESGDTESADEDLIPAKIEGDISEEKPSFEQEKKASENPPELQEPSPEEIVSDSNIQDSEKVREEVESQSKSPAQVVKSDSPENDFYESPPEKKPEKKSIPPSPFSIDASEVQRSKNQSTEKQVDQSELLAELKNIQERLQDIEKGMKLLNSRQEKIQKILDLNLERYNELVKQL